MLTRRRLLTTGASVAGASCLAMPAQAAPAPQSLLPAACHDKLNPILSWTNIPEYMWGSPERTSLLEPGLDFDKKPWPGSPSEGERLTLTGRVLTTRCEPIVGARLEFWHTDSKGQYDYVGFKFRGLQWADKEGRYRLETVMPGYYSPRRHIHYFVGVRLDTEKSGVLVTNTIGLPTEEEFKTGKAGADIPPSAFGRINGVLTAPYDFVIDVS